MRGEVRTKNLFITVHGLKITKNGGYLVIKGKDINERIPLGAFSNLFILANVNISTQLLKSLAKHKKYVFILNTAGKLQGVFIPDFLSSSTTNKRTLQYSYFSSEPMKVSLTKKLLKRKNLSAKRVIEKFFEYSGQEDIAKGKAYVNFSTYKDFIEKAETIEQLRAVDGMIMKTIYELFGESIKTFFKFKGRSYHPPLDEANAVLSIVHSLFYSLTIPYLISFGLDPYVGFFHVKKGNHAVFASDIMEIARPELVFFCAHILNSGYFQESDFLKNKAGVFLKPNSMKVLCKLFMEKLSFSNIFYEMGMFLNEAGLI